MLPFEPVVPIFFIAVVCWLMCISDTCSLDLVAEKFIISKEDQMDLLAFLTPLFKASAKQISKAWLLCQINVCKLNNELEEGFYFYFLSLFKPNQANPCGNFKVNSLPNVVVIIHFRSSFNSLHSKCVCPSLHYLRCHSSLLQSMVDAGAFWKPVHWTSQLAERAELLKAIGQNQNDVF